MLLATEEKEGALDLSSLVGLKVTAKVRPILGVTPVPPKARRRRRNRGAQRPKQPKLLQLSAETQHPTTAESKTKAKAVCGSSTVYNAVGGARMYCGRRDCPKCYGRRFRKVARRIRYFRKVSNILHYTSIDADDHRSSVRKIKSAGGEYACFPYRGAQGQDREFIVSNVIVGRSIHTDNHRMESFLKMALNTPQGHKISFSYGFINPQEREKKERYSGPSYIAKLPLPKMLPHVREAGGKIHKADASYAKWDVDPEKLTQVLHAQEIVAYQIHMPTLFADLRDAEDAAAEAAEIAAAELKATPLNKRGRPTALPVKLSHLLDPLVGSTCHNAATGPPLKDWPTSLEG